MKRAQIHGPGIVQLDEVPEPEVGPRDALVAVGACGICGSDVGYVRQGGVGGPADGPMPLGHELAGTVIALGSDVRDIEVGARVAVNPTAGGFAIGNGGPDGGFAPKLLVREAAAGRSLIPIPDDMPFDLAALAEPLGVGMNAVDKVNVTPTDKVAIIGAGPIGLAALTTAVDRGVEDIVIVDLSDKRLEVARALGAPRTINPKQDDLWASLESMHGKESLYGMPVAGTDVFIEASGAAPVLSQIIDRGKLNSRVSIVALHYEEIPVRFITVLMKQMTLQGAIEYPERFENMIELIGRRDVSPMITHRYALDDFEEAFSVAQNPSAGAKIMIEIG